MKRTFLSKGSRALFKSCLRVYKNVRRRHRGPPRRAMPLIGTGERGAVHTTAKGCEKGEIECLE